MPRTTIDFEPEQHSFIAEKADALDRSQAEIVRACVDIARGEENIIASEILDRADRTGAGSTTSERGDIEGRLAHLEEQIARLVDSDDDVDAGDDIATAGSSEPPADDHTTAEVDRRETPTAGEQNEEPPADTAETSTRDTSPTRDADEVAESLREYIGNGPPRKSHAQEAVVRAVAHLAAAGGAVETGEVKDLLWEEFGEHYSTKRTMWNSVDRYLEEMPGVEKAGYGEWAFDADSAEDDVYD